MRIVVIGGTGLIGSQVVRGLTEHGHDAFAAAPSTGVNTITGEGLAEVLAGADVVVDVSNSPSFEDEPAMEFFRTATTNLLAAAAAAGVGHHVALSVVGTEKLAPQSGYFRAKLAQESLIREADVPFTIVRATQFFEFVAGIADAATDAGTARLAPVSFQPMASAEVAEAVAIAAAGDPVGGIADVAGRHPQSRRRSDVVRDPVRGLATGVQRSSLEVDDLVAGGQQRATGPPDLGGLVEMTGRILLCACGRQHVVIALGGQGVGVGVEVHGDRHGPRGQQTAEPQEDPRVEDIAHGGQCGEIPSRTARKRG